MNESFSSPVPFASNRWERLQKRFKQDAQIVTQVRNWRPVLRAKWQRRKWPALRLRNGIVLGGPRDVDIEFLFHEIWLEKLYARPGYEIEAGQTVIDIGANIGFFALFAATSAPNVRVLAFEPFPGNAHWLRDNVRRSRAKNITFYEEAVASKRETRTLQICAEQWIAHSLSSANEETPRDNTQTLTVQCVGLDEVLERDNVTRCDLLKMDCEGSEYEIVRNASPDSLRRIRRIVGEFHQGAGIDGTGEELCELLKQHGFRIDHFAYFDSTCGEFAATNLTPLNA